MKKYLLLYTGIASILLACSIDEEVVLATNGPTPLDLNVPVNPAFHQPDIPEDNPMTVEGVALGRMLFYEKMLSGDNSMSCGSCHQQQFGFTDGKATSAGIDGIFGNRSTMAISNPAWEHHFFWDGRAATLEDQALGPIQNPIELNETLDNVVAKLSASDLYPALFMAAFQTDSITPDRIGKAIAQFERTFISANSRFDQFLRGEIQFTDQELRGYNLFATHPVYGQVRGGNCADCHTGFTFVNKDLKNNGVDVIVGSDNGVEGVTGLPADRGKFKVVSLRNIALTAPYMHDGRFATLEEVMDHYNDTTLFAHENVDVQILQGTNEPSGSSLLLTDQEKADIIVFLKTLTDSTFITNEALSDPF